MRVFYTQKTEQILKKMELTNWRKMVQEPISYTHEYMSDNWKLCALGERRVKKAEIYPKLRTLHQRLSK
jgi:hypothetical protein